MLSGTHLLKRASGLDLHPGTDFQGTWQQSDEASGGEDRNHAPAEMKNRTFQASDWWEHGSVFREHIAFLIHICNVEKEYECNL